MRRIAVFTDIHGNLDALQALYDDIIAEGISEVYHLGDAIAIGPEPKATLDFIIDKGIISLMGNHEIYYTDIISTGSADVNEGELAHQRWVAEALGESYVDVINNFEYECILNIEGVKIYLCHYPFTSEEGKFKWFNNFDEKIDKLAFRDVDADLYIFGHQHNGSDKVDSDGVRYVNLSSAGATRGNDTTYAIIEIHDNSFEVMLKNISYDKPKVIKKIDKIELPEKDFIKRIFFGID